MSEAHLLVKHDGVSDGLVESILAACSELGLHADVLGLVILTWADIRQWAAFVDELPDRERVFDYLASPSVLIRTEGEDVIARTARVKHLVRSRTRNEVLRNVLHSPDSHEDATHERAIFERRLLRSNIAKNRIGLTVQRHGSRALAAVQPCLFPWPGQLALAQLADVFVYLDTATWVAGRRYARNEVDSKTSLTVPLQRGRNGRRLGDVRTRPLTEWVPTHERALQLAYGRKAVVGNNPLEIYREALRGLDLMEDGSSSLTAITMRSTTVLADRLQVQTPFVSASAMGVDFGGASDPTGKLIDLCSVFGATTYLSGPLAKSYLDKSRFKSAGIQLRFVTYTPVTYRTDQRNFSALDLLARRADAASLLPSWIDRGDERRTS